MSSIGAAEVALGLSVDAEAPAPARLAGRRAGARSLRPAAAGCRAAAGPAPAARRRRARRGPRPGGRGRRPDVAAVRVSVAHLGPAGARLVLSVDSAHSRARNRCNSR